MLECSVHLLKTRLQFSKLSGNKWRRIDAAFLSCLPVHCAGIKSFNRFLVRLSENPTSSIAPVTVTCCLQFSVFLFRCWLYPLLAYVSIEPWIGIRGVYGSWGSRVASDTITTTRLDTSQEHVPQIVDSGNLAVSTRPGIAERWHDSIDATAKETVTQQRTDGQTDFQSRISVDVVVTDWIARHDVQRLRLP